MKIKYAIQEDFGCHPSEPCWEVTHKDLSIDEALALYKQDDGLEIIVCNADELIATTKETNIH